MRLEITDAAPVRRRPSVLREPAPGRAIDATRQTLMFYRSRIFRGKWRLEMRGVLWNFQAMTR